MSNRYVTDNEKDGSRRRMSKWRSSQRDLGRKPHELWLTEDEYGKLKEFLEALRLNKAAPSPGGNQGGA